MDGWMDGCITTHYGAKSIRLQACMNCALCHISVRSSWGMWSYLVGNVYRELSRRSSVSVSGLSLLASFHRPCAAMAIEDFLIQAAQRKASKVSTKDLCITLTPKP